MNLGYISRHRVYGAVLAAGLWILLTTIPATAQKCTHRDDLWKYSRGKYIVREVRIESEFDFLHAMKSYLKEVKSKIPLKGGDVFRLVKLSAGKKAIEAELDEAEKDADPRTRIRVILAQVENCQEDPARKRELDVVYRIFVTNYDSYLSHTWEIKDKEVERPATGQGDQAVKGLVSIKPLAGYNRTRRLFGGGQLQMSVPSALVERVQVAGAGSTTSNDEDFEIVGGAAPEKTLLNRAEYRLIYKHSDIPAGANRLRQGLMTLQVFGASKPLGSKEVVLRYGVSLEGGNQQTDSPVAAAADQSVADSGYGGLKTYLGATMNLTNLSIAASYGIQFGTRGVSTNVDFIKHLADISLTTQFLKRVGKPGKVHTAITLESRFAGGIIQNRGRVPVAERFFGGNVKHNFLEGDTWQLLRDPFIRSLPENRLSSTASISDLGGTRFYSANFTVGREIWGHPLLPKELAADPDFPGALTASVESVRRTLRTLYLNHIPGYVVFARALPSSTDSSKVPLTQWMTNMESTLDNLLERVPDEYDQMVDMEEEIDAVKTEFATNLSFFEDDMDKEDVKQTLPGVLNQMLTEKNSATCFVSLANNGCSSFTTVRLMLKKLADQLEAINMGADAVALREAERMLMQRQTALATELQSIDTTKADQLTDIDMKAVEVPLNAFINELNAVAVSPVGVFDIARVWPDRFGTRFGAGGGARLTILNFNVTLGYAFNLKRRPGDGLGAFFFSMDFTDIFR